MIKNIFNKFKILDRIFKNFNKKNYYLKKKKLKPEKYSYLIN
jgi:hypothetical protein